MVHSCRAFRTHYPLAHRGSCGARWRPCLLAVWLNFSSIQSAWSVVNLQIHWKRRVAWHKAICRCMNISAITCCLHVTGPWWIGQVDVAAGHESRATASESSFPATACTVKKCKLFTCFDWTRILSSFFRYLLRVPLLRNVCCLLRVLVDQRNKSR